MTNPVNTNTAPQRTFAEDDPFNPARNGEPIPQGQDTHMGPPLAACGDYLVKVEKIEIDLKVAASRNYRDLVMDLVAVEPHDLAGAHFKLKVPLFTTGEEEWQKRKRYQTLISMGEVNDGDGEGLVNYYWPDCLNKQFVFRCGQSKSHPSDGGLPKVFNEPADYVGLHAAEKWTDKEWVKPAPQDWEPRIQKPKDGGSAKPGTGQVPDDI